MTVATQQNVAQLYIAFFGRAPDTAGLNYWVSQSGLSLEQIAMSFFDQPETQALYGDVDAEAFIQAIYQNVLNRDAETEGLEYWVNELESGNISRDQMILAIINGAQGSDRTGLEDKAEIGLYWASKNVIAPDAFQVINEYDNAASVESIKQWIDGEIPSYATPSTYFVLGDAKQAYDLTGSSSDDVFVVKKFASAKIFGGEGSDTLDFSKFPITAPTGVAVNLSTGNGPNGMKFSWIENVRGTAGSDTLTGDSNHNILVSGGVGSTKVGAGDVIDAGVGDDRILFKTIEDVRASTINGGQGTDTLEITNQTAINVVVDTFGKVSDVEILKVGYSKENQVAAATVTLANGATFGTLKEVHGTVSTDKKGNPTNDVIQAGKGNANLDVSGVKLVSIEELVQSNNTATITIGAQTLESVTTVTGSSKADTVLDLDAKDGDTFDLSKPTFTNIDEVQQIKAATSTIIVNQTLVNSLDNGFAKDSGFSGGNFTKSTLQAAGTGLDLSVLADGDYNFKAIKFGTAKEVTVGDLNKTKLSALTTITGSENNADLLRVKPNALTGVSKMDLSHLTINAVERLAFEEVATVSLVNKNLGNGAVNQISGDDDGKYLDGKSMTATGHGALQGTFIDASKETAVGGLDLKGVKLEKIVGFGNGKNDATITINGQTTWDSKFQSLDNGSAQTINAVGGGTYDFSNVSRADGVLVTLTATGTHDAAKFNGLVAKSFADKFVGANAPDIVKGAKVGIGYDLGGQDDSFIGTNTANEVVLGGAGNDTIALADNTEGTVNMIGADVFATALLSQFNTVKSVGAGLNKMGNVIDAIRYDGKGGFADGGADDDVITSGKGNDVLIGGTGHDRIEAGDDNDILSGGDGADILSGGKGQDIMAGGAGDDLLEGNAGTDFLYGGKGRDVLRGDELKADGSINYMARDHFIFAAGDSGTSADTVDVIKDFLTKERANADTTGTLAGKNDVIWHNWFATDDAGAINGLAKMTAVAADKTGTAVGVADGEAYGTFFMDIGSAVTTSKADGGAATLLAAANDALDYAYTTLGLNTAIANDEFSSQAVQFQYGGKEYVVIDAFVTNKGIATNNYDTNHDLIVEVSDQIVDWSLSADDIVVTRWDTIAV